MEITGRIAVVTGGGAGIGQAISRRLAAEGASVLVAELDPEAGRETVDEIGSSGGRAALAVVDVSTDRGVREALGSCDAAFGSLDILVNNAGGVGEPNFPEAPPERWGKVLDLNLRAPMLATQLAVAAMRKGGGGAIVNIASLAGVGFGPHGAPEYAAAKAGLIRLTASLAPLATQNGVRVNCICPGWVDTPASRQTCAAMTEEQRRTVPAVMLSPDQIAEAAVMLIRDDSLAGRVLAVPDDAPWRLLEPGFPGG